MSFFKSKYALIILLATVILISAFVALQSIGLSYIPNFLPGFTPPSAQNPGTIAPQAPPAPELPPTPSLTFSLKITKKGNTLLVRWENLPSDAALLNIFRSKIGEENWLLWKTLNVTSTSGGADIVLTRKDKGNFSYYGEVTSSAPANTTSTPEILWTFTPSIPTLAPTSTPPLAPPSSPPPPQTTPTSTTPQSQPPPPTPPPAQSTTTQSTPPPSGGTSPPTTQQPPDNSIVYYTPQGQVSGTSTPSTAEFWVHHTDQKIEIGWQNLPTSTDKIIVSRGTQESGPWAAVLTQENPDPVGPFKIKIGDDTLYSDYYYKLEARDGSTIVGTFGPILLPAL